MGTFTVPYGTAQLDFTLPDACAVEVIAPADVPAAPHPLLAVQRALDQPVGGAALESLHGAESAAIAINDKTRPVPHQYLLPPLLAALEGLGLPPERITLIIATGTHPPMPPEEFARVVPPQVLARYPVLCHDCDVQGDLVHLGETERGTPIWINRHYMRANLRLVVGNIEPHQFMGFSGGVKSAAIGLAGRATVNHNHALMRDPGARLGHIEGNPARQDVEDIGRGIGVHFALNAILNRHKQIVHVLAGEPGAVMAAGVPLAGRLCQVAVAAPFDLVIASPGGHPKDINLYQAQKALAHAARITRPGGTVIVVAACPEGTGSRGYEQWMLDPRMTSYKAVFQRFAEEGFRAGPHKAIQIAQDAVRVHAVLVSQMEANLVRRLLLHPAPSLPEAIGEALAQLGGQGRIAIMPQANATVPVLA